MAPLGRINTISLFCVDADRLWGSVGVEFMEGVLSPDECERSSRFRSAKLKNRFIAGRYFLRKALGGHLGESPKSVAFSTGFNGKPEISSNGTSNIQFSFSRSAQFAVCGLSDGARIGVDAEQIKPVSDMPQVAKQIFSESQFCKWQSLDVAEQINAFYRAWTRKEAISKIDGRGITHGVRDIIVPLEHFDGNNGWLVRQEFKDGPNDRSMAALLSEWYPFDGLLVSVCLEVDEQDGKRCFSDKSTNPTCGMDFEMEQVISVQRVFESAPKESDA